MSESRKLMTGSKEIPQDAKRARQGLRKRGGIAETPKIEQPEETSCVVSALLKSVETHARCCFRVGTPTRRSKPQRL